MQLFVSYQNELTLEMPGLCFITVLIKPITAPGIQVRNHLLVPSFLLFAMNNMNIYFESKLDGKIETDFRSNQAIIMIHVWMVHRKLITMGRQGQHVQEAMFDLLWDDTSNRIRGKGVNELSVHI